MGISNTAKTRIITGACIAAGLALAFILREFVTLYLFDLVVLVLLFFAVYEVTRAKKFSEKGISPIYLYVYVGFAYLIFFIGQIVSEPFALWVHLLLQLVIVGMMLLYAFLMHYVDKDFIKKATLNKQTTGQATRLVIRELATVILYPIAPFFALFALNHINADVNLGFFALLCVFAVSTFTDTFAYMVGSKVKGKKLCPTISPNKTISGAIGGLFGGVLGLLLVLAIFTRDNGFQAFINTTISANAYWACLVFVVIGLIASAVNQLGDIYASWLKRKYGVKDFSKLLPGHGGVMDRVDGIIMNAVFILLFVLIIVFIA
jgi:phosphatidate cytidylyltransferase